MRRDSPRSAFTLIELLIVMAIIAVLASMILATLAVLGDSAKDTQTKQRLGGVEDALRMLSTDQGAVCLRLQDALLAYAPQAGLRFRPLMSVISHLTNLESDPLDYTEQTQVSWYGSGGTARDPCLPPRLASLYDPDIGNMAIEGGYYWKYYQGEDPSVRSIYDFQGDADRWLEKYNMIENDSVHDKSFNWFPMRYDPEDGLEAKHATIDWVILFGDRIDMTKNIEGNFSGVDGDTWPFWYVKKKTGMERVFNWVHRYSPHRSNADASVEIEQIEGSVSGTNVLRWSERFSHTSHIGEALDRTLEVLPDERQPMSWYLRIWPPLHERESGGVVVQRAWPDAAWDQAVPDPTKPPLWEMPFGEQIISRKTHTQIEQYLRRDAVDPGRTLAEFSPLATISLLLQAEIIETADQYRGDRDPGQDWNDAWGNPLIVVGAAFIAPRYDIDPGSVGLDHAGTTGPELPYSGFDGGAYYGYLDINDVPYDYQFDNNLEGGRDWLLKQCAEIHGAGRKFHLACGAIGPIRTVAGADNDIVSLEPDWENAMEFAWSPANDDAVLRAAWLHIREVCRAEEWDEGAMVEPAWTGIRKETGVGDVKAFLTMPKTLQ